MEGVPGGAALEKVEARAGEVMELMDRFFHLSQAGGRGYGVWSGPGGRSEVMGRPKS